MRRRDRCAASPSFPTAASLLHVLLRVFVQPRALHGLLAAELRDLLQRGVELVGLAVEVVQRVDVHVHHLDELREPVRLLPARLGLPLRVELLDALGELLARLAQPAPRRGGGEVCKGAVGARGALGAGRGVSADADAAAGPRWGRGGAEMA